MYKRQQLSQILEMDREKVFTILTRKSSYEWVKRKISPEASEKMKDLHLPGIHTVEESKRDYLHDTLAPHLLGFTGVDNQGLIGIEKTYDSLLQGEPGKILVEHDAAGRKLDDAIQLYVAPQKGKSLVLTIDETIQYFVERELDNVCLLYTSGDACLLVAGQGPYEGELREKVEYWGLHDKIKFLGFLDDMGRNGLLAGADLAVFPSLYEPFGIVALEAMAAGVPVVVSDTGGLGEIIEHGVDGYKAPPGNVKMLATYICGLLLHPDLAQNFADQGRKKMLTRYNWQYIAYETAMVLSLIHICLRLCGLNGRQARIGPSGFASQYRGRSAATVSLAQFDVSSIGNHRVFNVKEMDSVLL